jgi:hypothetical protein
MKIHSITNSEAITNDVERPTVAPRSQSPIDSTDFSGTSALKAALLSQPDIRPDKVAEAKGKASTPLYPPQKLIQGISRLIADQLLDSNNTEA